MKRGIEVYSNASVASENKGVKTLSTGKKYQLGSFRVQPISVQHNVPNYAYLIESEETGRILFATDLSDFPYKLRGINHLWVESNFSDECLIDNLCNNEAVRSQYANHLSIDKCIEVLKRNYSPSLQSVMLLHLSSTNSNEREFVSRVKSELGFSNVFAAEKNLEIPLNFSEF